MLECRISTHPAFLIGEVDRRLFGSFVEQMGRCVYGGIFEPDHPTADENGFRTDVLELTREAGVTLVRYPGGNFLSGYNWEDAVGPVEDRPTRLDLAWRTVETNQFGTNEFMEWCRVTDTEPMFCVNLGTRGVDEARRFLEYCNHSGGSALSDSRRSHGVEQPHAIKVWGLGNEMDAYWQLGHKPAREYGRLARETAKAMLRFDPELELSVCGSSNQEMASFGQWEYEVLDECYEQVDYVSLHQFFRNDAQRPRDYLFAPDKMDAYIKKVVSICDAVAAKKKINRKLLISFDEYNVWWRTYIGSAPGSTGWTVAPPLYEEDYDVTDAVVFGGALITLINNADRVKIACQAQLVNILGLIRTRTGGGAWRQTIFHPFAAAARLGRGTTLRTVIAAPTEDTESGCFPLVQVAVVMREDGRGLSVLAVNKHASEAVTLAMDISAFAGGLEVVEALSLSHRDPDAANVEAYPDAVRPVVNTTAGIASSALEVRLPPMSWNTVALA